MSEEERTVVDEHGQTVLASSVEDAKPIDKDLVMFTFEINLNHARDLIKADMMGTSDPFCKVFAQDRSFTTQTVMKNLNPDWNEETVFTFFKPLNELQFEVFDWDKGSKHDSIGQCKIDISKFHEKDHPGFDGDLTLTGVKSGRLNVSIKGRRIALSELERRIEEMEVESTENKGTLEEHSQLLSSKKEELSRLTEENTSLNGELSKIESSNKEISQRVTELQSSIQSKQNDIATANKNIQNIQKTKQDKEVSYGKLEGEKTRVTEKVREEEAAGDKLQLEAEKLREQVNQKGYEITEAEKELAGAPTDGLLE